jgi:hypothetical protein
MFPTKLHARSTNRPETAPGRRQTTCRSTRESPRGASGHARPPPTSRGPPLAPPEPYRTFSLSRVTRVSGLSLSTISLFRRSRLASGRDASSLDAAVACSGGLDPSGRRSPASRYACLLTSLLPSPILRGLASLDGPANWAARFGI